MASAPQDVVQQNSTSQRRGQGITAAAERKLSHLKALEAESIYILREAAAEFSRPVMLYSIGKDSSVMLRLAQKAFYPGKIPFPLLHVDTSYKFPEMIEFRDEYTKRDWRGTDRPPEPRSARRRRQSICTGNAEMLRPAEDQITAGCACGRRIQRGIRRGAAGRRKVASEGEDLFLSRRARAVGSQEPAP